MGREWSDGWGLGLQESERSPTAGFFWRLVESHFGLESWRGCNAPWMILRHGWKRGLMPFFSAISARSCSRTLRAIAVPSIFAAAMAAAAGSAGAAAAAKLEKALEETAGTRTF